ncbi:MAG: glutamate mutase L [Oscillospiraceae bacterium]
MEEAYTLMGLTYVQTGKDLTQVSNLVVTGGSLIHTEQTSKSPLRPVVILPQLRCPCGPNDRPGFCGPAIHPSAMGC